MPDPLPFNSRSEHAPVEHPEELTLEFLARERLKNREDVETIIQVLTTLKGSWINDKFILSDQESKTTYIENVDPEIRDALEDIINYSE